MGNSLKVLIVDDNEDDALLLVLHLSREGFDIQHERVATNAALSAALDRVDWDIVLCDFNMPGLDPFDVLQILRNRESDTPFIAVSGTVREDELVDLMKAGADDLVLKDRLGRLGPAILRQLDEVQVRRARKEAERRLEESEEQFRVAFETAPHGMALVAPDGRWLEVNQALCDLVGYGKEELLQADLQTITYPHDLESDMALARRTLARELPSLQMEKRYIHKDGHIIWVLLSVSLVRDVRGEPLHFVFQTLDLTERKRAEAAAAEANARLKRSNEELEQFAYVASHDLQEPLRAVASYTQLLDRRYRGKLDEKADQYIAYASEGATRMQDMISELLEFSRVSARKEKYSPMDSEAALRQALGNLKSRVEEAGAEIRNGSLPQVVADNHQLVRVFQNLVSNAIKFRGERPPVVAISAEQDGDEVRFCVSDNGIGIDPQFSKRIFLIFQRLHSRDAYDGSGIGLAVCKRIVDHHGGRIWFESQPGEGARFFFTLPAAGGR